MKRMILGNKFGVPGVYISQPGDDIDNPTKSLLLDSRFATMMQVHYYQRVRLSKNDQFNGTWRYFTTQSYPALGYAPMIYTTLITWRSEEAAYPNGIDVIPGARTIDSQNISAGSSSMSAEFVAGGDEMDLDLFFVIFRNPAI